MLIHHRLRSFRLVRLACIALLGASASSQAADSPEGIPVRFKLDRPGTVTLVIDDANGTRVRNLIAGTKFEAGEHVLYWDGRDESEGVKEYVDGIFRTAGKPVVPGRYRVRGLVHDGMDLRYEFSVYTAGNPPWSTGEKSGRWMADHTPPIDALYLPARGDAPERMLLASFVAEGGDSMVWTDMSGRKLAGVRWVGGHWTGALALTRDAGSKARENTEAYAVSSWLVAADEAAQAARKNNVVELRVSAMSGTESRTVWTEKFDSTPYAVQGPLAVGLVRASEKRYVSGAAAYDGLVAIGLVRQGEIRFVDDRLGKSVGSFKLADTRGLAFDQDGKLLVLVGNQLRRYDVQRASDRTTLANEQIVVREGLGNPSRVTSDAKTGQLYVSDWGDHTVKVFAQNGAFVRSIGSPGGVAVGAYDPTHMENPSGMAIAPDGSMWLAEENQTPKRVSIWSADGKFVKALYGPPQYGGGGNLSADKKTFYYFDGRGLAFDLDWATGNWSLRSVYFDSAKDTLGLYKPRVPGQSTTVGMDGGPQTPIELNGRRYLTNVFSGGETSLPSLVGIWLENGHVVKPVAVIGDPTEWPLMTEARFKSRLPEGFDFTAYYPGRSPALVAWSDQNDDGQVQPEEVTSRLLENYGSKTVGVYRVGRIYIGADLGATTTFGFQFKPRSFSAAGVPIYDVADAATQYRQPLNLAFSEGHDTITDDKGFVVLAGSPVRGFKDGKLIWTYPNAWAGLHPGHKAPPRQYPGQLLATTKVIGMPVTPPKGQAGPIWAYNGDRGNVYLMTTDGLFVADLFQIPAIDAPKVRRWDFEKATRGMDVSQVNVPGENFLPTINQTSDGEVYLVTGKEHCSFVKIGGLDSIQRLPEQDLNVTQVPTVAGIPIKPPSNMKDNKKAEPLRVVRLADTAKVDGNLDDWKDAQWVPLDKTATASVAIAGDRLVIAYRTKDASLLNNRPESLPMMFKTGGAMDLMLRTDLAANHDNANVAAGDVRVLISESGGKPMAAVFRQMVKGAKQPVPFSSPWRTVTFDRVDDISQSVTIARKGTDYECSIPLKSIGMKPPQAGQRVRGDVGLLRGEPGQTTQRLYWTNKDSGIVEDVPSEAELAPQKWGTFLFD